MQKAADEGTLGNTMNKTLNAGLMLAAAGHLAVLGPMWMANQVGQLDAASVQPGLAPPAIQCRPGPPPWAHRENCLRSHVEICPHRLAAPRGNSSATMCVHGAYACPPAG